MDNIGSNTTGSNSSQQDQSMMFNSSSLPENLNYNISLNFTPLQMSKTWMPTFQTTVPTPNPDILPFLNFVSDSSVTAPTRSSKLSLPKTKQNSSINGETSNMSSTSSPTYSSSKPSSSSEPTTPTAPKQSSKKVKSSGSSKKGDKSVGSKTKGNLPKDAVEILKMWLVAHMKEPYPTELEKQTLANDTNLTLVQINNWMINAIRRICKKPSKAYELIQEKRNQKKSKKQKISASEEDSCASTEDDAVPSSDDDDESPLRSCIINRTNANPNNKQNLINKYGQSLPGLTLECLCSAALATEGVEIADNSSREAAGNNGEVQTADVSKGNSMIDGDCGAGIVLAEPGCSSAVVTRSKSSEIPKPGKRKRGTLQEYNEDFDYKPVDVSGSREGLEDYDNDDGHLEDEFVFYDDEDYPLSEDSDGRVRSQSASAKVIMGCSTIYPKDINSSGGNIIKKKKKRKNMKKRQLHSPYYNQNTSNNGNRLKSIQDDMKTREISKKMQFENAELKMELGKLTVNHSQFIAAMRQRNDDLKNIYQKILEDQDLLFGMNAQMRKDVLEADGGALKLMEVHVNGNSFDPSVMAENGVNWTSTGLVQQQQQEQPITLPSYGDVTTCSAEEKKSNATSCVVGPVNICPVIVSTSSNNSVDAAAAAVISLQGSSNINAVHYKPSPYA